MDITSDILLNTSEATRFSQRGEILLLGTDELQPEALRELLDSNRGLSVTLVMPRISDELRDAGGEYPGFAWKEKRFTRSDLSGKSIVIVTKAGWNAQITKASIHEMKRQADALLKVEPGADEKKWRGVANKIIWAFLFMVIGHIIISYLPLPSFATILTNVKPYFDQHFALFVLTGFFAQMVDGILSMGYGVTSATLLMGFGISPVSASASIHASEVFTTGVSGYSHYKFGNVNPKMFKHLVIPGVIGAIFGALLLVFLGEKAGKWLMPLIALYALFLGVKILTKALGKNQGKNEKVKRIGWLAGAGGFLDSFGGGGWGPIVTSSLIAKGRNPKYTVGTVCLTEFFVTVASATTFFLTVGVSHWNVVLGLLIGGGIAAPFAARLAGRLPKKTMMVAVGIMVIIWCARMLVKSFSGML